MIEIRTKHYIAKEVKLGPDPDELRMVIHDNLGHKWRTLTEEDFYELAQILDEWTRQRVRRAEEQVQEYEKKHHDLAAAKRAILDS